MTTYDIFQLRAPVQDYIRALETQVLALNERIQLLEEQFRLAQSKRFAFGSEKLTDRIFDEAEQAAAEAIADEDADEAFALPETGLPPADVPVPAKRGRKPLPANLPRTHIEYDLPDDRKICPCCSGALQQGRRSDRAAAHRGQGIGVAACAIEVCVPPLRSPWPAQECTLMERAPKPGAALRVVACRPQLQHTAYPLRFAWPGQQFRCARTRPHAEFAAARASAVPGKN